jgi:hypothetical protein
MMLARTNPHAVQASEAAILAATLVPRPRIGRDLIEVPESIEMLHMAHAVSSQRQCGLMGLLDGDVAKLLDPPRPVTTPARGLTRAPPALPKKHSPLATAPAPERDGRKNMENISPGSFRYGKAAAAGWPL